MQRLERMGDPYAKVRKDGRHLCKGKKGWKTPRQSIESMRNTYAKIMKVDRHTEKSNKGCEIWQRLKNIRDTQRLESMRDTYAKVIKEERTKTKVRERIRDN